jgi:uncharacterized protein DUF4424
MLAIICLCLLTVAPANADDTLATLAAGGLVPAKTSQIVMESENLQISVHEIMVQYVFRNTSPKDIEAVVAFPLPDLEGMDIYYTPMVLPDKESLNFVNFRVTSDGKLVPTQMEARAFLGDHDITARLRSAGLPVSVLLGPLNSAIKKLSAPQRKELEKEHFIVPADSDTSLPSAGGNGWWAGWVMRVKFYWTQRFPANGTVELTQSYRPVVGGGYIAEDDDGSDIAKRYCGGAEALRWIKLGERPWTVATSGDVAWVERSVNFILTTGNDWSGPIRHFHLLVESASPRDIVLTCMPGLKRVGPTRYELTRDAFRPSADLKLDILQPNRKTTQE